MFSTSYDKNYEVTCFPSYDSNGYLKKPGEKVRFIDRMYITPVKVASGMAGNAAKPAKYKFYINKTDVSKIQTGAISKISSGDRGSVYYTLTKPDGTKISGEGSSNLVNGSFQCYRNGTILFLKETTPPAGGKKRRYTRKQNKTRKHRKTRKSNHRVKSYKRSK
jgi:hypothetical protein